MSSSEKDFGWFYELHNNDNNLEFCESKEDRNYLDLDDLKKEKVADPWDVMDPLAPSTTSSISDSHFHDSASRYGQQPCTYHLLKSEPTECQTKWGEMNVQAESMVSNFTSKPSTNYSEPQFPGDIQYNNKWSLPDMFDIKENICNYPVKYPGEGNVYNYNARIESGVEKPMRDRKSDNYHMFSSVSVKNEPDLSFNELHSWPNTEASFQHQHEAKHPAMGCLFDEQNGPECGKQQGNVVERYQVMLPPIGTFRTRKSKQCRNESYFIRLSHSTFQYAGRSDSASQNVKYLCEENGRSTSTETSDENVVTASYPSHSAFFRNTLSTQLNTWPIAKKLHYRCQSCGERLATRNSLLTHIKSHQQPYCRLCLLPVKTIEQLQVHINKCHPQKSPHPHTTVVTSKYGRRRRVFLPLSLIKGKKFFK